MAVNHARAFDMAKLTDCWQRKQLQAFVHLPPRNPDSIRLLKVESADPHDVVRCSIQEFKLSERPSYTALSYVWEDYGPKTNLQTTEEKEQQKAKQRGKGKRGKPELDPKKKRTFICNGKHLQVGASLFAALTGLRRSTMGTCGSTPFGSIKRMSASKVLKWPK